MARVRPLPAAVPPAEPVEYGRQVIEMEAAALGALARSLDHAFLDAVSLVLSISGRLVVTGMGKSGHVGRKIAATLASVGLPALFVHPAEAAHGDLGMLVRGDGMIALSNSGATRELIPVVHHAKRLEIPIVGITAQSRSLLATEADVSLILPAVREACPANLAPTTSTAMMMALGDALAMVAMAQRGVSRAGFGALHPGGSIGSRLMRVAAMMHAGSKMPLVSPDAPMHDVIVTMTSASFGIAGVVDRDGRLIGAISDGDLRRHADVLHTASARDVMTPQPVTIAASSYAEDALALMNHRKITAVFVTDDADPGRPAGLVHIHDFLRLDML